MLFTSRDITLNYLINRCNLKRESNSATRTFILSSRVPQCRALPSARARAYTMVYRGYREKLTTQAGDEYFKSR